MPTDHKSRPRTMTSKWSEVFRKCQESGVNYDLFRLNNVWTLNFSLHFIDWKQRHFKCINSFSFLAAPPGCGCSGHRDMNNLPHWPPTRGWKTCIYWKWWKKGIHKTSIITGHSVITVGRVTCPLFYKLICLLSSCENYEYKCDSYIPPSLDADKPVFSHEGVKLMGSILL